MVIQQDGLYPCAPWGRGSYIGEMDAASALVRASSRLLDESYQGMALVSTSRRKRNHNQAWLMPMRFRKNPRNIPAGSFKPQRGMGVNGRTSATGAHVQAQPGRSQMKHRLSAQVALQDLATAALVR